MGGNAGRAAARASGEGGGGLDRTVLHIGRPEFPRVLMQTLRQIAGECGTDPIDAALDLLDAQPGQRALDVGSGSGWTSALLGELVGSEGSVIGVDVVPELVAMARENLGSRRPWVRIELAGAHVLGWPDEGPYDRILVSADGGRVPADLESQLAPGGRMILPAASEMMVVERAPDGALTRRRADGLFSFVPLR